MILGGVIGIFRPSPPARLPGRVMARALRAIGDATKQSALALSSLPGVRMRVCLATLQPISIPHLRGHGPSGPAGGMLVANAMCAPSGPLPSLFFLSLVIMVCAPSLPRPSAMRTVHTAGIFPGMNLRTPAAARGEFGHGTGRRTMCLPRRPGTPAVKGPRPTGSTGLSPARLHTAPARPHTVENATPTLSPGTARTTPSVTHIPLAAHRARSQIPKDICQRAKMGKRPPKTFARKSV